MGSKRSCLRRTVDDLSVGSNVFGMFVAGLAVVSSGMQQIYVGTMQVKHKLNANELLSNTAPAQVRLTRPPHASTGLRRSVLLHATPQGGAIAGQLERYIRACAVCGSGSAAGFVKPEESPSSCRHASQAHRPASVLEAA